MSRSILAVFIVFALKATASFAQAPTSGPAPAAPGTSSTSTSQGSQPSAATTSTSGSTYASDDDAMSGDRIRLQVSVKEFLVQGGSPTDFKCAPKGSIIGVTKQNGDVLSVRFVEVPAIAKESKWFAVAETPSEAAIADCNDQNRVNDFTQYTIKRAALTAYAFRRSGVTFGALVVPFKFYLGSANKLSASSTIAPYVGYRGPGPRGLSFTPIVSAGLALVPVSSPGSSETSTKSAFSTAIGILMTSNKNEKFSSGFVLGKDFLNKADRVGDPTVDKLWFSLYVGYKL